MPPIDPPSQPVHAATPPHWSPDEFRAHAYRAIDLIADYWRSLSEGTLGLPVQSERPPGQTAAMLPSTAPDRAEPFDAALADIERIVLPGLLHWQSPMFFGYFPANVSGPAVVGEILAAGLGVQGMLWSTSPACTEVETRVLDWMARAIGLPEVFLSTSTAGGGIIQGTASDAALVALVAARRRAAAAPKPLVVYASSQAHSSIVKAAMIAGIVGSPTDRHDPALPGTRLIGGAPGDAGFVRLIGVDDRCRMRHELLEEALVADRAAGRVPIFVAATLGTTASMAVDDLSLIGPLCRREHAWLHVDAAYAGSALICPEHQWMLRGIEHADSFCFNPHKWLLTNFDCSLFWTADRYALTSAMSITPEYLRNPASDAGTVWDYRDWQVPLGRRFRAIKLWLVLRAYGLEGLRDHIREHVRLAEVFESLVRADARFEVPLPRGLSLVCFRLRSGDHRSAALLTAINNTGKLFLSHAVIPAPEGRRYVLRAAIGATLTRETHVREAWRIIQNHADQLA